MDNEKLLQELKDYWEKNNIPNISFTTARFIRDLIKIKKAKNILEIWTANGFSTINFALELKNQNKWKITSIDFSQKSFNDALKNFKKFDLEDFINPILWNALFVIPELKEKYDLVFIDWMKRRSKDFLDLVLPKTKKNWVIIIDDVIKFKEKMIGLWEYLQEKNIKYNIIPIDIDDGIMMIVR